MKEDFTEVNNKIQEFDKGIRLSGSVNYFLLSSKYFDDSNIITSRLLQIILNQN